MPIYYGIDMTYIVLVIPAMLFALWASFNVKTTFTKYAKVPSKRGMTGRDAARRILDANGLYDVAIAHVAGDLTDHYNPKDNTIYLSDTVDTVASAAAVGVAAHEAGHAVQHATGYGPIKIRMAMVPITNIGSKLALPLIILGFLIMPELAYLGVALFGLSTVFQLVTLPVEFNASNRAMAALSSSGLLDAEEQKNARKVLTAAALTYVAALAVALAQLLRLILIVRRSDD